MSSRALAWIEPEGHPGASVYGILTVGALLAAESDLHESYVDAAGSTAIAIVVYWLAHSYSDLLGDRLVTGGRLTVATLVQALAREWPIVRGAAIPLLALLLAWAFGAAQASGVEVALWTSIAALVAFELLAGVRAGVRGSELVLEVCVGAALGFAVLALRIVLH